MLSVLLAISGLAAVELGSSYVLFRYFARIDKPMRPEKSAAYMLAKGTYNKLTNHHDRPVLTIDNRPLFDVNDMLGYALHPGEYRITEQLGREFHAFRMSVTADGARAAAYTRITSAKRIFVAGDSSLFGWGVDDEYTIPWLIQARLPGYDLVNLTLTSYSTVHALLQLRQLPKALGPDDIVIVEYHELSNKLNVQSADVLQSLKDGYEIELGDPRLMQQAILPYGRVDAQGRLSIEHISLSCAVDVSKPQCVRPVYDAAAAMRVTELVFEQIMALHPGHLVIAFFGGADSDPVIASLRQQGATIVDLRTFPGTPVEEDIIPTDFHMGPFWQRELAQHLYDALRTDRIVEQ